jgi:hypothetical protein
MIHSISRVVVGLVAVTTLTATSAGAAHAQKLSYADGASDVHVFQADDTTTLVGDVVNTDVRSVRIDHRNLKLKAKFGYTDLTRTGVGFASVLHVLNSEGRQFDVVVAAGAASWRGGAVLQKPNGKELECASIRRSIDYDANTVKVSLGTDCLGEPRWVRVALEAVSIQAEDDLLYIDDAQHPDIPTQGTTGSRKIRRG